MVIPEKGVSSTLMARLYYYLLHGSLIDTAINNDDNNACGLPSYDGATRPLQGICGNGLIGKNDKFLLEFSYE